MTTETTPTTTEPSAPAIKIKAADFFSAEMAYAQLSSAIAYHHAAERAAKLRAPRALRNEMREWMRYHAKQALIAARRDVQRRAMYSNAA